MEKHGGGQIVVLGLWLMGYRDLDQIIGSTWPPLLPIAPPCYTTDGTAVTELSVLTCYVR